MVSPALCSSLFFLSSLLAPGCQALVVSSASMRNGIAVRPGNYLDFNRQHRWSTIASAVPLFMVMKEAPPADFTVIDDDDDDKYNPGDKYDKSESPVSSKDADLESTTEETGPSKKPKKGKEKTDSGAKSANKPPRRMDGTSWLDKNAAFTGESEAEGGETNKSRSFRGTRVFVQGLPKEASWQDLKDHFAIAGNVVFASVSVDRQTGISKGVGLVQYETTEMAKNAIKIMRDHPLSDSVLYVREDVQEKRGSGGQQLRKPPSYESNQRNTPPAHWECADDENSSILSAEEKEGVIQMLKDRDAARRRKNYEVSDALRQKLKSQFGVHCDDRLKQWWVSFDGSHVPQNIQAAKGDGRWGKAMDWRQIPTTPENDMCVSADLVNGLLRQRDIARKEKDFATADALLEEARQSPDGDLYLRIHDESRTWRIWTSEPPPRAVRHSEPRLGPAEQCINLVREKAPHKEEEIRALLQKFPGRYES